MAVNSPLSAVSMPDGEFSESNSEALRRAFQRHNWLDTYTVQQCIAGLLGGIVLILYVGGLRPALDGPILGICMVLLFVFNLAAKWSLNHQRDSAPIWRKFFILYVEDAGYHIHWTVVLFLHVCWAGTQLIRECQDPVLAERNDTCQEYLSGHLPLVPFLHCLLSIIILALLGGKPTVTVPVMVAMNGPWLYEMMSLLNVNNSPSSRAAIVRGCCGMVIITLAVCIYSVSHSSARRSHFDSLQLLQRKHAKLGETMAAERDAVHARTEAEKSALLADSLRQVQRLSVDFISHKLRNPLHVLEHIVAALRSKHDGEEYEMLQHATREVTELAHELVLHHELSTGGQEAELSVVAVQDWLDEAKGWCQRRIGRDPVVTVDAKVPERVPLDPHWAARSFQFLLRLLETTTPAELAALNFEARMLVAPKVTSDDVRDHRNIFTSSEWLTSCYDLTRLVETMPLSEATPRSPACTANVSSMYDWFLNVEIHVGGFSVAPLLTELGRSLNDAGTTVRSPTAAPVLVTSTRMDLRLAKLSAAVTHGRIGILEERAPAGSNTITKLILQLPMHSKDERLRFTMPITFPSPLLSARVTEIEQTVTLMDTWVPSSSMSVRRRKKSSSAYAESLSSNEVAPMQQAGSARHSGSPVFFHSSHISPRPASPRAADAATSVSTNSQSAGSSRTCASTNDPEGESSPFVMPRVLVVDDEQTIRKIHCRLLQKLGLDCDSVDDGDRVLPALRAAAQEGRPFTAILLDLVMKRQHGDAVCAALRHEGYTIPIVAATANANPSDCDRLEAVGFSNILCKPFSVSDLRRSLTEVGILPSPAATPEA